jgi:hypothetical protein
MGPRHRQGAGGGQALSQYFTPLGQNSQEVTLIVDDDDDDDDYDDDNHGDDDDDDSI